jgi:hypothetical protein
MSARPLVLVPGACLGGWAWRDVAARLRSLGHDVFPVTLTGLGERVHLASRTSTCRRTSQTCSRSWTGDRDSPVPSRGPAVLFAGRWLAGLARPLSGAGGTGCGGG